MLTADQINTQAKFLRSIAEKNRLKILHCLQSGEKTVNEIVALVDASQSNISQHLSCLRGCGIIEKRQEGKFSYYSLATSQIESLLAMLDNVIEDIGDEVSCCEQLNNKSLVKDAKQGA